MNIVVDRIENSTAHCKSEDGKELNLQIGELPAGVKEQDWLTFNNGKYELNPTLTASKRSKNAALYKSLKEKK